MKSSKGKRKLPVGVPEIQYEVVACYPHDPTAFTEGLVFHDGTLYESTGPYPVPRSVSTLRQVEISSGRVIRERALRNLYFAEGLAIFEGKVYQLTYQDGKGFVYDLETFSLLDGFFYEHEGWGLTTDRKCLIMSNGSNHLRLIDPDSLEMKDETIDVNIAGKPLYGLNELEYINGSIYANVFRTDYIFRIDPKNGSVLGRMDLSRLHPKHTRDSSDAVLNGIAYDRVYKHLFVTGKYWPTLFEIRLTKEGGAD